MSSNQTIDGVPRSTLEKLVTTGMDGGVTDDEWDELRALLDAPACKRCNGTGWVDNLRPVGTQAMDCPDCKPSTQLTNAQRRAADYKEQQAFNDWAWNKEGDAIGRMDGQAAAIEAWHARAKLAEQPAPVAVVLPDQKAVSALVKKAARQADLINGANYYTAAELAAEAVIDELKRLNPSL